jgi:hypothetical protein
MSNGRDSIRKWANFTQSFPGFRDDRLNHPPLNGFDARGLGSTSPRTRFPHRSSILTAKKSWRRRESQYAVCWQ